VLVKEVSPAVFQQLKQFVTFLGYLSTLACLLAYLLTYLLTQRHFETFRNKNFLRWGVVSPTPNPQDGGPPLICCPRLLIQYIRSYPS